MLGLIFICYAFVHRVTISPLMNQDTVVKVLKKIASIKKTKKINKCYCVEKSVMQMLYFDTDSYSLIQQNSQFERGNEMVQLNLILCVSSDNVTDPEYTS